VDEPYAVNDQEFEAVLGLDAPQRYEHFLKRICDTERVYLLVDGDQLVVLSDENGGAPDQLPLWPHPRYGEAYRDEFGGAPLGEMGLEELVERALPSLAEDGVDIAVFPTPKGESPVVPPTRLRDDVLAYHDEWYGGWPK
jgi:hypothetical protein